MSDYESDILIWSEHQAALLRRVAAGEPVNEAPDWPNIVEEIESVGRSQVDAVELLLFQAVVHMLKAEAWPFSLAPSWRADARGFGCRPGAGSRHPCVSGSISPACTADALRAVPETIDGQPPLPVPAACPVTLDELLDV